MNVLKISPRFAPTFTRRVVSDKRKRIVRSLFSFAKLFLSKTFIRILLSRLWNAFNISRDIRWNLSIHFSAVVIDHCIVHTTSVVFFPTRLACFPNDRQSSNLSIILHRTMWERALRKSTSNIRGCVISNVFNFPVLSFLFNGDSYPLFNSVMLSCFSNILFKIYSISPQPSAAVI